MSSALTVPGDRCILPWELKLVIIINVTSICIVLSKRYVNLGKWVEKIIKVNRRKVWCGGGVCGEGRCEASGSRREATGIDVTPAARCRHPRHLPPPLLLRCSHPPLVFSHIKVEMVVIRK